MTALIRQEEADLGYFKELCKTCMASGKYSKEINEATMLNIMLTARDLGISPMKAINGGFYIVNGKISLATGMMSDMVRAKGHSVKIVDSTNKSCVLLGTRKDNGDTCQIEFTMEDAKLAQLSESSTWKKYPKAMLFNRAMSMLARMLFSDVVGNTYSEDEAHDIQGTPPNKRPDIDPDAITVEAIEVSTVAHDINDLHVKCGVGTIEDVKNFVRYISVKKECDEQKVIDSMMSNEKSMDDFKNKLSKRIESFPEAEA